MIKEKELCNPQTLKFRDVNNDITVEAVSKAFEEVFQGFSILITQDEFQYKAGFMKSEVCPCIVLTSGERGNDLSRKIIALKKDYESGIMSIIVSWFGDSLSERLGKEIEKQIKKDEKDAAKYERRKRAANEHSSIAMHLGNSINSFAKGTYRNKKVEKLLEQREQALVGEEDYYTAVNELSTDALSKLAGMYECIG